MDNILGREADDVYMANIIKGNITNADEVLKSDAEVTFEEEIKKGEVEVLTMEDVKESYNNQFWKGEDIEDFNSLERKAVVAVQKGNAQSYREIYVKR